MTRPNEELDELRDDLLKDSQLNINFIFLTVSACIIATLGLLMNSTAVIIGAMIVAPLMMPLRGLALGTLDADIQLLRQSFTTLGLGTLVAILISGIVGQIFAVPATSFNSEIMARTQPNLADLGVALAAGGVSGFAKIRPSIADAVAGTAISVALMPPLCVVGIALSQQDWSSSGGAFLLYLTNFLGITLACLLVFIWGGYGVNPRKMRRALVWLVGLTSLLVVPLLFSLINLIRYEQLEGLIRESLRRQTITFGQASELIDLEVQWSLPWSSKPAELTLTVRAIPDREPLTARQVQKVEEFLERRFGQKFRITVLITEFLRITSEEQPHLDSSSQDSPFPDRIIPEYRQEN